MTTSTLSDSCTAVQPLKVLVVEDNPINQRLIVTLLKKRGCDVTTVVNGQEAVDVVQGQHDFDLILMDIRMPVMDGREATRNIRAWENAEHRKKTPIVAVTAEGFLHDVVACQDAGMDGYLAKPFNAMQFNTVMNRFVDAG